MRDGTAPGNGAAVWRGAGARVEVAPRDGVAPRDRVAVIGAGPAGCAAAFRLQANGVRVVLLGEGRRKRLRMSESLPAAARPLLRRLGAWEEFERDRHPASPGIASAWAAADLAGEDPFTAPLGRGWLVDRDRLDASLAAAARSAGVPVLQGVRVTETRRDGDGWRLSVLHTGITDDSDSRPGTRIESRGGRGEVRARFVVDASGRAGVLARRLGEPVQADRLMCAYAHLDRPPEAARRTLLESAEDGWWYAAAISAGPDATPPGRLQTAVGFFSDPDVIRRASAATPGGWHALLRRTRHVYGLLGAPGPPSAVRSVLAASHCLTRLYGEGWAAAGDAGSALDPLSSAGVVTALRSGFEVADGVQAALGGDYGALAALQRRTRSRYTSYLLDRNGYYGIETRWPDAPFWLRRANSRFQPGILASPYA
ncbi:FAD-dependent monooxygenase [Nonomuraea sp. NPDC052129]|uniref:FAD-dependent monooxygenase n=1 Tax=Nonomuraea sp. NPDC052129 TaxID=3154651 RepID=UPI0034165977